MGWGGESQPSKPSKMACEKCGERATKATEIPRRGRKKLGSGTFIYSCPRHHDWALRAAGIKQDTL